MQRILNYGSFFQAYSLKTMLESLGHDVVFVDYKIDWTIETRRYYKKVSLAHLRMLKRMLFHRHNYEIVKSNPSYKYFLVSYKKLGLSSKYHFRTPVDILVIGSDEVFNCLQNNEDVGYSLELFGKIGAPVLAAAFPRIDVQILDDLVVGTLHKQSKPVVNLFLYGTS